MRTLPLLLAAASLLPVSAMAQTTASQTQIDPKVSQRIDRILKRTPLIDGHNDLPWALREDFKSDVTGLESGTNSRTPPLMTDMARLRAGRVGGQFWSVYISGTTVGDEAIRITLEQIDTAHRIIASYPDTLRFARSADEMEAAHRAGRIGSMLGIEGGRQIGGSMAALRRFHDLGVRYMTLTHNQTTEWADAGTDEAKHDGLSPFGLKVVEEMNRLGMLVDLSHVSPATMRDSIAASKAPVIFSHSSAAGINPHPRNIPDDVLRLLPANGGLAMVTWVPSFLSPAMWKWDGEFAAEEARIKTYNRANAAAVTKAMEAWVAANPRPVVGIKEVADHIDHVAKVAGHDHVGIGGDLDGIPRTPVGLEGVEAYPRLFAELIRRGWSDANLAKLAGGNVLRALRGAEATARSMKNVSPSMAVLEPAKTAQ
jgi:membrane dipeptidase